MDVRNNKFALVVAVTMLAGNSFAAAPGAGADDQVNNMPSASAGSGEPLGAVGEVVKAAGTEDSSEEPGLSTAQKVVLGTIGALGVAEALDDDTQTRVTDSGGGGGGGGGDGGGDGDETTPSTTTASTGTTTTTTATGTTTTTTTATSTTTATATATSTTTGT